MAALSPLPDIGEVERKTAGDDEDGVDAHVVAGARVARGELLGGEGNAAQAILIERQSGGVGGGALLDLDEGDHRAASGDQIDLATVHFDPAGEDPPAVEAEPPGGDGLGAAAALFGEIAVQAPFPSARARA